MFFSIFYATDTATDRSFSIVVLAQILRVRQYSFQELQRNDFHSIIVDRFDTCHTDILNDTQVSQVFLSERHPEACAFDGREILDQ